MDLETAVFRIAARQAAKLESQGLRVSLEPDALKELKKNHAEFFVSGAVQATGTTRKPSQSGPGRGSKSSDLISRLIDVSSSGTLILSCNSAASLFTPGLAPKASFALACWPLGCLCHPGTFLRRTSTACRRQLFCYRAAKPVAYVTALPADR